MRINIVSLLNLKEVMNLTLKPEKTLAICTDLLRELRLKKYKLGAIAIRKTTCTFDYSQEEFEECLVHLAKEKLIERIPNGLYTDDELLVVPEDPELAKEFLSLQKADNKLVPVIEYIQLFPRFVDFYQLLAEYVSKLPEIVEVEYRSEDSTLVFENLGEVKFSENTFMHELLIHYFSQDEFNARMYPQEIIDEIQPSGYPFTRHKAKNKVYQANLDINQKIHKTLNINDFLSFKFEYIEIPKKYLKKS